MVDDTGKEIAYLGPDVKRHYYKNKEIPEKSKKITRLILRNPEIDEKGPYFYLSSRGDWGYWNPEKDKSMIHFSLFKGNVINGKRYPESACVFDSNGRTIWEKNFRNRDR